MVFLNNKLLTYTIARGVNGVMAFATIVIFTRLLGQEGYGEYALLMSFVGFVSAFFFQWIAVSCGRFLPGSDKTPIIYSSTKIVSAQSVVIVLVLAVIFVVADFGSLVQVLTISTAGVAMGLFAITTQIENSAGRASSYAAATVLRSTLTFIGCTVALLFYDDSVYIIFAIVSMVAISLFALFYKKGSWGGELSLSEKLERDSCVTAMRKYGIPVAFSTFCMLIIDYSDKWLISHWYGVKGLGAYAAAYDLSQLTMGTVANVFSLVFFPAIVAAYSVRNEEKVALLGRKNFDVLALLLVLSVTYVFMMSQEMSVLLFSADMAEVAQHYFPWVVLAISIGSIKTYCFDLGYKLARRSQKLLFISFVMVLTNLAANFVLIPLCGPVGGAFSTALAMIVGSVMSCLGGQVSYLVFLDRARNAKLIGLIFVVVLSAIAVKSVSNISMLGVFLSLGVVAFSALMYIFLLDVCGVRTMLRESNRW